MADRTIDKLKTEKAALIEDNERMKPKEIFADAVTASKDSILIGDLAKILKQKGIDIGQNRLFQKLRNNGYLTKEEVQVGICQHKRAWKWDCLKLKKERSQIRME